MEEKGNINIFSDRRNALLILWDEAMAEVALTISYTEEEIRIINEAKRARGLPPLDNSLLP